jgi:hypothetical protein
MSCLQLLHATALCVCCLAFSCSDLLPVPVQAMAGKLRMAGVVRVVVGMAGVVGTTVMLGIATVWLMMLHHIPGPMEAVKTIERSAKTGLWQI